jgi:uncharacterized protein YfaQ (DUF2300 family)
MKNTLKLSALTLGTLLALGTTALAQTAPAATVSPEPAMTMAPAPSAAPETTAAPAATTAPAASVKAHGKIKKLQTGSLPFSQMSYGITHPVQEIQALRKIKKIDFNNIRIVKVSPLLKARLRLHADTDAQTVALDSVFQVQDAMIAQTNGSNSPIANLQYVLANINVSNALNNILNGSNVGVNVSLADVLNGNKIGISQVLGVYVHGFSIINTIIK